MEKLGIRLIKFCLGKRFKIYGYRNIFTIVGYNFNKRRKKLYIIGSYTKVNNESEKMVNMQNKEIKLNGKIFINDKKKNNYKLFTLQQLNNILK